MASGASHADDSAACRSIAGDPWAPWIPHISRISHNLDVSGAEVALVVDHPPFFPGQMSWQRLRGETVHPTWSEDLKRHGVVATFVVASNMIAVHCHAWSLGPPHCRIGVSVVRSGRLGMAQASAASGRAEKGTEGTMDDYIPLQLPSGPQRYRMRRT